MSQRSNVRALLSSVLMSGHVQMFIHFASLQNFAKSVLPILQTIRAREDGIIGTTMTDGPNSLNSNVPRIEAPLNSNNNDPSKVSNRSASQMPGYSRYDQERFRKEGNIWNAAFYLEPKRGTTKRERNKMIKHFIGIFLALETEGFQINTMGTYRGITLKSITEGAQPKAQNIPGSTAGSVVSMPINRMTNNNNNHSTSGYPTSQPNYNAPHMQQENIQPNANRKRTSRTPIIIIPAASTSLITMYNAKEILQDLRFISTEEKKNQGFKRENEVLVQRQKEGHSTTPYRVIDNPQKLTSEEWERVVAVFVQGPSWQFKEWPFAGPSEIFSKICAFHLKWDDMNLDQNVAKWAVNILGLSRTKRHLDRASLIKIWDTLDRYMMKHKPFLRF
uniref:Cell division control protein 73 C-terminal domain-containing protein n=1 Tax=Romanomermis culicivorax TaxID=13658 RepID=A0A915HLA7_ROMCU